MAHLHNFAKFLNENENISEGITIDVEDIFDAKKREQLLKYLKVHSFEEAIKMIRDFKKKMGEDHEIFLSNEWGEDFLNSFFDIFSEESHKAIEAKEMNQLKIDTLTEEIEAIKNEITKLQKQLPVKEKELKKLQGLVLN